MVNEKMVNGKKKGGQLGVYCESIAKSIAGLLRVYCGSGNRVERPLGRVCGGNDDAGKGFGVLV